MSLLGFILFSTATIIIYFLLYLKTRDLLNPPGLMISIWLFMAGVSHLNLGTYQTAWVKDTYWSVLLSALTMTLTSLVFIKSKRARTASGLSKDNTVLSRDIPLTRRFHKLFYVWAAVCLFAALWVIIEKGFSLTYVFTSSLVGNKGEWQLSDYRFIEYFTNMLPHISIISFFKIVFRQYKNKIEKLLNIVIIIISLYFTLFVMVSRGTVIIQLLGYLYILNRKRRLSFGQLGRFIIVILFLFGAFSLLRWQDYSSTTVYTGKFDSRIFNSIYNYVVYCYQNFDTLVRIGSPLTQYKYVFMSFTKLLGIYDINDIVYVSVGGFNAVPFIFGYYHDLGNLGVVLYSSLVIIFISILYNKSNKNEAFSIVLAMFQKGIFSLFFGDYILLFNGQILPMVIAYFLVSTNRKKIKSGRSSYSSIKAVEGHIESS